VQSRFHGGFGDLEIVGDLSRRPGLVVRVENHGAVLGGQLCQRVADQLPVCHEIHHAGGRPDPVRRTGDQHHLADTHRLRGWRPGCPVEPARLRRVDVDHIGFDGQTQRGELIVHEDLVPEVITIFEQLYQLGYPIEKIRTVDHYPAADDELSMEDNNTSAFNCRGIPGTNQWSQHAYGRAIDLNPLLNPCIYASGAFQPKNAAAYLDRSRAVPGLLHGADSTVHVFTDRGWRWGGYWTAPIDYQHFERP
jgi:hypothetical protein